MHIILSLIRLAHAVPCCCAACRVPALLPPPPSSVLRRWVACRCAARPGCAPVSGTQCVEVPPVQLTTTLPAHSCRLAAAAMAPRGLRLAVAAAALLLLHSYGAEACTRIVLSGPNDSYVLSGRSQDW